MLHTRRKSTTIRVVSALAAVSLVAAGCGTSGDDAAPSSTAAGSSSKAGPSSVARPAPAGGADDAGATEKARALADAVTLDGAIKHLEAFQDIANRNGGNRALGSPGYLQSLEYAEKVLRDAGYNPVRQEFTQASWTSSKAEVQSAGAPVKATALQYSGATEGAVTAKAVVTGTQGCSAADLEKVTAGTIAVVQRGKCTFGEKYKAAAAKGVKALVITNNAAGDWKGGTLGLDDGASIAVVGVAQDAAITDGQDLTLTVDAKTEKAKTWNVIAETAKGDDANVQMVGAHLDSVAEGPGINDNGTGSAAVLETAIKLGANADVKNKIRFALWGAEEEGLVGSEHYVSQLSAEQASKIKRYLNFDMLGSPNGGYFTFDGDGSSKLEGGAGPAGSGVIEQVFRNYFAWRGVPVEASAFDGRSDYGPFKEVGIAAGGMDTGADAKKTEEQQRQWGGTVGDIFDPNYHSPRDTIENVNREMYRVSLGSVGFATAYFAAL
ncbi:M28 family peptidase [Tsukamurella sputi]|uniref:M28 family peptidase n=1 Tax=Tsukamurella sputi TaxID=2591848 RepID=A0A5C5RH75_9ACTN|nr:M28 family peptidase [Tsukamurella sputi]TWS22110.1 M28 family peptidase [Tsukamurella sputi]